MQEIMLQWVGGFTWESGNRLFFEFGCTVEILTDHFCCLDQFAKIFREIVFLVSRFHPRRFSRARTVANLQRGCKVPSTVGKPSEAIAQTMSH